MLILPGWRDSVGTIKEHEWAVKKKMPIAKMFEEIEGEFISFEELQAWWALPEEAKTDTVTK